jgi:hypothetical protein
MATEEEVRLLELKLADIKRQIALPRGRPARLVDRTYGTQGKGDSCSSGRRGRPMTTFTVAITGSGNRSCRHGADTSGTARKL